VGSSSSPFVLPSSHEFPSPGSSSPSGLGIMAAGVPSLDNHYISNTSMYPTFEPSWNQATYDASLSQQMAWNASTWVPQLDYSSQMVSHPNAYQYAPPTGPPVFAQAADSYYLPQSTMNDAIPYFGNSSYGQFYGSQSQTSSIPSNSFSLRPTLLDRSVYT